MLDLYRSTFIYLLIAAFICSIAQSSIAIAGCLNNSQALFNSSFVLAILSFVLGETLILCRQYTLHVGFELSKRFIMFSLGWIWVSYIVFSITYSLHSAAMNIAGPTLAAGIVVIEFIMRYQSIKVVIAARKSLHQYRSPQNDDGNEESYCRICFVSGYTCNIHFGVALG